MRLRLDTHLPLSLAGELRRREIDVEHLSEWHAGYLRNALDKDVLKVAVVDSRVFVTYDLRTIPSLLGKWAADGKHHSGIILIDDKTIRPDDVGALLGALLLTIKRWGDDDWKNRVIFLPRD
jgi:hypothetical protein